jgi:two-component system, chemotaxis family, protein-glutamate methylesterase/glutaminase
VSARRKVRVLVVDESTIIRRLVKNALADDPEVEVAGTAATIEIALAKIPQINPDVITFDPETPDQGGSATFHELRKQYPHLPVIMFGAQSRRGRAAAMGDFYLGASDFIAKPARVGNLTAAALSVRAELISKIKVLCNLEELPYAVCAERALRKRSPSVARMAPPEIIAIGVSTGGPNALADIFRQLDADFSVPIVVVQHMPPMFTRLLAHRLNSTSHVEVSEAEDGQLIGPGRAWLAPGNFHMVLANSGSGVKIHLHQEPPENSCRPAADVLFRSIAKHYGPAALVVVLTGMGQDGLRGCEAIHEAGGSIIAQDEATSVVWGMPGSIAAAGLADQVLPLPCIAGELNRAAALRVNRTSRFLAKPIAP